MLKKLENKQYRMYIDGVNFRRIGRFLGVHHQTIINWINAYAEEVPSAPVPDEVNDVEMDELFTYIGSKKSKSTSSSS
ncbi:MAG: helix-turn-helix domain-containing protein [Chloroflexi bacterium]|nr:helix-turn-helix domain-containing protein [Chloroflexota bacterium]